LLIGTGKSFLIQVICDYLRYSYAHDSGSDDLFSFAVVAPTGLAAYNVNGMTMHRFFKYQFNTAVVLITGILEMKI
jgi:hypothetical protein